MYINNKKSRFKQLFGYNYNIILNVAYNSKLKLYSYLNRNFLSHNMIPYSQYCAPFWLIRPLYRRGRLGNVSCLNRPREGEFAARGDRTNGAPKALRQRDRIGTKIARFFFLRGSLDREPVNFVQFRGGCGPQTLRHMPAKQRNAGLAARSNQGRARSGRPVMASNNRALSSRHSPHLRPRVDTSVTPLRAGQGGPNISHDLTRHGAEP